MKAGSLSTTQAILDIHPEMINWIDFGAESRGSTALHVAAKYGFTVLVQELLKRVKKLRNYV